VKISTLEASLGVPAVVQCRGDIPRAVKRPAGGDGEIIRVPANRGRGATVSAARWRVAIQITAERMHEDFPAGDRACWEAIELRLKVSL